MKTKNPIEARLVEYATNAYQATFSKAQANEGDKSHSILWILDEWCEVMTEMQDYIKTYNADARKRALAEVIDTFVLARLHKVHMAEVITQIPAWDKCLIKFDIVGNNVQLEKKYVFVDTCNMTRSIIQLLEDTSDQNLEHIYRYWKIKSISRGRDAWKDYDAADVVKIIRHNCAFIKAALG